MSKFQTGKIYAIRSFQTDKIYIGSTHQALSRRLQGHRGHYQKYKNQNGEYNSSCDILKYDDYYIELLENYPCNSKEELNKREGELIRQYIDKCVNKNIAGRTVEEYMEDNKEYFKMKSKQYREDNKDVIQQNYINNREKYLEDKKVYYEKNKQNIIEKRKEYCEKNQEIIKTKSKEYYQANIETKLVKAQQYREANREVINAKQNVKTVCECGGHYTINHKLRHLDTKKHQSFFTTGKNVILH